ncbi:MAG TPA: hypothetical protein PKE26_14885 [Kiritimatiellia bacterium]|nr:hypothetical protein [Kiritimatiellia bacterium]HMP00385.1 hypothetical protein [Kiritimatiellia bacterium]
MNEPWENALKGAEIPHLRLATPPRIYSTEPSEAPEYEWKDQEVVLGIWLDGEVALCQYEEAEDRCVSPDGKVDFHATGRGHPYWYVPLNINSVLPHETPCLSNNAEPESGGLENRHSRKVVVPNRQLFYDAFPDGKGFAGAILNDPNDPDSQDIERFLAGKSWTEVPYDHLRMLQLSLRSLSNQALRHFFPAFVFEAMTDLNGEDIDYSVLQFMASDQEALLRLGYTSKQLGILLDAVEYIRIHCKQEFDGLDESMRNHRRHTDINDSTNICQQRPSPLFNTSADSFPQSETSVARYGRSIRGLPRQILLWLFPPTRKADAIAIARQRWADMPDSFRVHRKLPSNAQIYNQPKEPCWCIYAPWNTGTNEGMLRSTRVIMISKRTGVILYDGSANDEG